MADQLGRHMLGCYGNPVVQTPNIDRLAQQGIRCDSNYVQNPICMPSRASMFTGRYPSVCGTRINGVPLRESETTLPQALAAAGYHTFAAGKLHFRNQLNSTNWLDGGHPEYEGGRPYYGFQTTQLSDDNRLGPYHRWIEREHPEYATAVLNNPKPSPEMIGNTNDCWVPDYPAELHQSNWIADRTIDYIESRPGDEPWFAFCSFADPHHPFNPPEPYASMYEGVDLPERNLPPNESDMFPSAWLDPMKLPNSFTRYTPEDWDTVRRLAYGMTSLIDDAVGRVLGHLEAQGQLDNTIVLFTADHGELLGEHGLLYKGTYHFDELIRTPMIWRWPDGQPGNGRSIAGLTQSLDLMPTILDVCGVPTPDAVQGQSQRALLCGESEQTREWVLTENHNQVYKPDVAWVTDDVNTLVTDEWKITVRTDGDTGQLFDRVNDPREQRNLWDDPDAAATRARLSELMVSCLSQAREHPWRRETLW